MTEPVMVEDALSHLKMQPNDAEAYRQLGTLYIKRGDLRAAWQAYSGRSSSTQKSLVSCWFFGNPLTICDDRRYAS